MTTSPRLAASTGSTHLEASGARLLDALGARAQAYDDVHAGVLEVQRVGVALRAESDDGDGLAVEEREVCVVVVEHGAAGYRKRRSFAPVARARAKQRGAAGACVKLAAWPVLAATTATSRAAIVRAARVHEERLVGLFFGQRALAIGALQPVNYTGTSQSTERARAAVPAARAHRERLRGDLLRHARRGRQSAGEGAHAAPARAAASCREDAGPFPAGTPYSAFDPELMLWTWRSSADSARVLLRAVRAAAERLGARRRSGRTTSASASCSGCRGRSRRRRIPAFRAWWDEMLAGDGIFLTDEARSTGAFVAFEIPMPGLNQPPSACTTCDARLAAAARARAVRADVDPGAGARCSRSRSPRCAGCGRVAPRGAARMARTCAASRSCETTEQQRIDARQSRRRSCRRCRARRAAARGRGRS